MRHEIDKIYSPCAWGNAWKAMEVTMLLSQRLPLVSSLCQKGIQCEAGGQSCDFAFGLKFLRSRFLWSEIEN